LKNSMYIAFKNKRGKIDYKMMEQTVTLSVHFRELKAARKRL
jgi:predicted transport protein